jgi:putative ABC transport system permease protein
MLRHYLRSAWRTIRRNPFYSLVNVGCLAIGIAVCMTVMFFVLHEHSYDRWQKNSGRIFLLNATFHFGQSEYNSQELSYSAGPTVQEADPRIESFLRVFPTYQPPEVRNAAVPDHSFIENNFVYADSNFYRFFPLLFRRGDPDRVFMRPFTLVLTQRMARKYFGTKDPVGRVLKVNGLYDFEITGVVADPPSNTVLQYDFIAARASMARIKGMADYLSPSTMQLGAWTTWLLLKTPGDAPGVEKTLSRLAFNYRPKEKNRDVYRLTPLTDFHLDPDFANASTLLYLKVFPLVAALILLLALVNYMSLATARAAARAKEIGVRKITGAGKGRIAAQFYTESGVFAILSFVVGTMLFLVWRPYFFGLLKMSADSSFLLSPAVLTAAAGLLLLVILVAGSYPSLVLSAFRPVTVLYGKMNRQRGGERVRKGFIVFQFAISMSLVMCCTIIAKEVYFIRHADSGVDRENVIMIPISDRLSHPAALHREISALPGIRETAMAQYPLYKGYEMWMVRRQGSDKEEGLSMIHVDKAFLSLLGLQWERRPSREEDLVDSNHILLNEAAVQKLDIGGDALGQRLQVGNGELIVAGVVKDFNFETMQSAIHPLGITVSSDPDYFMRRINRGCLLAKIQSKVNIPTLVDAIGKIYSKYDKQTPFEYSFADDAFNNLYEGEERLAGLLSVLTMITIVIACLGLFALATFAAEQRVKEIGIRKVLGASTGSIGLLLSKDFLRPVLLAVLIACPVSWWTMYKWLQDYAYRTPLSWWIFGLSGLGLLGVALVTVLTRSLRAGRANPVDNLRTE